MFSASESVGQLLNGLPYGVTALPASSSAGHYLMLRSAIPITSPKSGTQSTTFGFSNVANSLSLNTVAGDDRYSSVVLKDGALYRTFASQTAVDFRYDGTKVLQDVKGTKLNIPASNTVASSATLWTDQFIVAPPRKFVGYVSSAPTVINQDGLYTNIFATPVLLNSSFATKQWNANSAFYRLTVIAASDRILLGDCVEGSTFLSMNTPSNPLTCSTGTSSHTTIEQALNGTVYGGQSYPLSQGTVSTSTEGVRIWVANSAESSQFTRRYRVYFELAGKVYTGSLVKSGATSFSGTQSGLSSDIAVRYNDAAVQTLKTVFAF
jgi:hypothetical protein